MAIGGAVSVAAVRHMHSTVERETDQLKNADANEKIGVSADGCGTTPALQHRDTVDQRRILPCCHCDAAAALLLQLPRRCCCRGAWLYPPSSPSTRPPT
jgi:hypothetical protein